MDKPVILLADDDELLIKVLQRELEREGYDVLTCFDGERALDLNRHAAPDLILLDVMMPRMSGYEVCQKIREKYLPSELPVIMITAKNQVSDLVEGLADAGQVPDFFRQSNRRDRDAAHAHPESPFQIGRASCRERV